MKIMRNIAIVAIALVMVLGGMPFDNSGVQVAHAQDTCAQTHVVAPGQNLFRIGLAYGVRYDVLQTWNNLPNANLVYVGQVLCVSGPWNGGSPVVNPPANPPSGPVVVRPGNPFGPTADPRVFFPEITLGDSFQLSGYNFPPNRTVTIGLTTLGNARPYPAFYTTETDAAGNFLVLVTIPESLQNAGTVAVEATTSGGYYAINWFYNR